MSLAAVIDTVVAGIASGSGVPVSDRLPTSPSDIPAVAVSVSGAERPRIGIGGIPSGPRTGALLVSVQIDLAHPVLGVGADSIDLLDPARTTLVVPNGPIVTASGADGPPFAAADATLTDSTGSWTITNGEPTGRQARINPDAGTVTLGQAPPATGVLTLTTHVGMWEATVSRFAGLLHLDVISGAGPFASSLARQVADAMTALEATEPAFDSLVPVGWGPATMVTGIEGDHVGRRLDYRFVFEREVPFLPTSGGIIRRVAVVSHHDGATETYGIPIPTT